MKLPLFASSVFAVCVCGCSADHSSLSPQVDASPAADGEVSAPNDGASGSQRDASIVLGACPSIPNSSAWELITPSNTMGKRFDYTEVVKEDPVNSGTVYVGVHTGPNGSAGPEDGLYKSTDCGANWKRLTVGRNSDLLSGGAQWGLAIDPTNTSVMYTVSGYGAEGVWKSVNGGIDWDQIIPDSISQYIPYAFFSGISIDDNDSKHLLASVHSGTCTGPYAPTCVAETNDAGATWRLIKGPADLTTGYDGVGAFVVSDKTLMLAFPANGLWVTNDDGVSWHSVAGGSWGGGNPLVRDLNGALYVPTATGVVQSGADLLAPWSAIPAGQMVGFTRSDTHLYGGDQWSRSYWSAPLSDPKTWTKFTTSGMPSDNQGSPFLAHDRGHHILYSSNFAGGLSRIGAP